MIEVVHEIHEPHPFVPDQVLLRHAHILQSDEGRAVGVVELRLHLADRDTRAGRGDQKQGDAAEPRVPGADCTREEIRPVPPCDPLLLPVHHVAPILLHSSCPQVGHVTPSLGLGDHQGDALLPPDHRREHCGLHGLRPVEQDGWDGHGVDLQLPKDLGAATSHLIPEDQLMKIVRVLAGAPELLREQDPLQPGLVGLGVQARWIPLGALDPILHVRLHLGFNELPAFFPEILVGVGVVG
mmetsp:Transcript_8472/g.21204  ORF Transcript_8472/g.21204 Transcript_8472/m.21204 type:complete len:240 (+) Transcript_8472:843-1562(+)